MDINVTAEDVSERRDEPSWFRFSASLRIFGVIPDLDEITRILGVQPTHSHHRGARRTPISDPYEHDMWSYTAPVDRDDPLHAHIGVLWSAIRPHKSYLLQLKQHLTVDVFLGYRSNSDTAGLEIPYQSLEMFTELQVPLGLSIIIS